MSMSAISAEHAFNTTTTLLGTFASTERCCTPAADSKPTPLAAPSVASSSGP